MTFSLDQALRDAQFRLSMLIEIRTRAAISRIDWMHAVGSGICYCGDDYEHHPRDETHTPTEMPVDKGHYDDHTNNPLQG